MAFGFIREAFAFGKVLASAISATTKTVLVKVEGDEGDADSAPTADDLWGHAPLLYRPVDPDSSGHCEAVFYRLGDERVCIATKDRRWQIEVAEGEVIVRAMGSGSPAYVHLKPDGTARIKASAIKLGASAAPASSYVKGETLNTALTNLVTALNTYASALGAGSPANPVTAGTAATAATALATALTSFTTSLTSHLSTIIKGE